MATVSKKSDISVMLRALRQIATQLSQTSIKHRSQALALMAEAINLRRDAILEANTLDLEISREMAVPEAVTDWLKLTPERVQRMANILKRLATIGETMGAISKGGQSIAAEVAHTSPLGIVALVYEAFPDLGAIAAGLCLQTGNLLLLKGGNEASQTNQVLIEILKNAIADTGLPTNSFTLIPSEWGDISRATLVQQPEIDLVIPYGRPQLVEQMLKQAMVPIVPTKIGNCYLCWMPSADLETVYHMIVDSHQGEPEAVNSIEKVIIVGNLNQVVLVGLWERLQAKGFELRAESDLIPLFELMKSVQPEEWRCPYLTRTVAFRRAATLNEAVAWINDHSNGHADSIATASYTDTRQFITQARSASVYLNRSPRFSRNPQEAAAISLGMSSQAGQSGGLVGLSSLMRVQRIVHET